MHKGEVAKGNPPRITTEPKKELLNNGCTNLKTNISANIIKKARGMKISSSFSLFRASCRIRTNDPEITNHVLWPTELKRRGWVSLLYRAATTNYLCCDQALEDSSGAGRIGLTHFCFASAKVDIIFKTTILSNTFF